MSNEELVKLIKQGINSVENMELLYLQNERFIYAIANKYNGIMDIEDLMQEAYFGLLKAVECYETEKETRFITYAVYWIRQAIKRYIDNNSNSVRIPTHMQQQIYQYRQYQSYYLKEYNRKPTSEEYASGLNISLSKVKDIEKALYQKSSIKSLDEYVKGSDDLLIADTVSDDGRTEQDIIEKVARQQLKNELWETVSNTVNDSEYTVITSNYIECKQLDTIAKDMGITREFVIKHKSKALKALRCSGEIKKIAEEYEVIISRAFIGTGLSIFKNTGTSSTEYTAIKLLELDICCR